MTKSAKHLVLLYHFFHPDDVISARLFSEIAQRFAGDGWQVTAIPAARWFESNEPLPSREQWDSIDIRRVWRPKLKQSANLGRVVNALVMLLQWSLRAVWMRRHPAETVIVGTDPILSVLVAIPWRIFRPRSRIVHWCHDLYPEAAFADGVLREQAWYVRLLKRLVTIAYRRCDLLIDLGACMRQRLQAAAELPVSQRDRFHTITPWALVEPPSVSVASAETREELFGPCELACLYSGNLGRAHEFELFVELARLTQPEAIAFCFAGRGPRMAELNAAAHTAQLTNVRFADFAAEGQLEQRLAAGDVHLVSLRADWTGTVVPSKFFGSLAIGRPVLFVGSEQCAIAGWIQQYKIGWHLRPDNVATVAAQLRELAASSQAKEQLNQHCQSIYYQHFSREKQLTHLAQLLHMPDTMRQD